MSYTPTNWQTGDTVTAEKLNKMEQGIEENAGYWIPLQFSNGTFSVPVDKVDEVLYALYNPDSVFINGAVIGDSAFYGGYRVNENEFYCPLSAEVMEANGMSGTGNIIIKPAVGVEDVSVEVVPDTFIVTLTPTAQDYSGTMDKTPEEIDEAYRTGRRIRFRVMGMDAEVDATQYLDNTTPPEYYQAAANVIYNGMLVQIITSRTDQIYYTIIYPLTPMS